MSTEQPKRITGSVVFFIPKKGYGFIKRDDNNTDIFVFYTDIMVNGFKTLYTGDIVEFEESYTFQNKLKAGNVVILERSTKHKEADQRAKEKADKKENV